MPLTALSLVIVGIQFPNKRGPSRRFEVELCKPGEPVDLVLEPKNPADKYAVAIYSCRGVQIGYVTAERAPMIHGFLIAGRETKAVFQGVAATGAWIRVAFDGEQPIVDLTEGEGSLPSHNFSEPSDGFWPDPIYPDE